MARTVSPKITSVYFVAVFSHMANSTRIALWNYTTQRVTTLDIMIQYLANIVKYDTSQIISIRWLDDVMICSAIIHVLHTCSVAITVRYATITYAINNGFMSRTVGSKINFLYFIAVFSHMANSARIALWRNTTRRVTTTTILTRDTAIIVRHTGPWIVFSTMCNKR